MIVSSYWCAESACCICFTSIYTSPPHGCLFLYMVYKFWFWAHLQHNIFPLGRSYLFWCKCRYKVSFQLLLLKPHGFQWVKMCLSVVLMLCFGVPVCMYRMYICLYIHLEPTPSQGTGLEFYLLINDFLKKLHQSLKWMSKFLATSTGWWIKFS